MGTDTSESRRSAPGRTPSLAATLLVVMLLPLLLAAAATGWYGIARLERATQERMQQDIELVARAIRMPLSHALDRGYRRTVQQALDSAFTIDRVYGAYVYDSDGNTVAASGFRNGTVDADKVVRLASTGERQGEFDRIAGEEIFSYFVPLTDAGGRISGLLQVTRQGSDFDDYLAELRLQSLLAVLATGLLLASLIVAGHRWAVGRHLRAMDRSLARIGRGDLRHRLPARGAREFRHLATAVNDMLDAIEASRRQVADLGERLHRSEKMAALGQLAGGVAHELGSPLSTIDGKAERTLRRPDLPDVARETLGVVRRESARMERIIRQLLDVGRSNPIVLTATPADVPLRAARDRIIAEGVAMPLELDDPEAVPPLVDVDAARLDQALMNLLRNAVQAARTRVRAGIAVDRGRVLYHVDDDGPGIAPEARERLFDPFFTTKPVGQGTGLGLAVAHAAARDHGGDIVVAESPLGGARLTLILPRAEATDARA